MDKNSPTPKHLKYLPKMKCFLVYLEELNLIDAGSRDIPYGSMLCNTINMTMRLNFIHECIQLKTISLKYINADLLQVADVLTKLQPVSAHELHSQCLIKGHNGMIPKNSDLNRRTPVKTDLLKNVNPPTTYKTKFKVKT